MKEIILIAEDDVSLQGIYDFILSNEGYETLLASNGTETIDTLKNNQVDLVLLDLMMPGVDGVQVLQEMRKHDWGKDVKVVVLTNIGKSESSLNLKRYGVLETAVKVDLIPNDLIALVQKHLSG